ncbi:MAG: hypothetical protein GY932_06875 [Arcobacter sp.]|nr:hypothetical protein [Flavobacteriaceae bacterium]MCP4970296.1 hypothetical protein [Arcobacter sp.]
MDSKTKTSKSMLGGISKITIIGAAIIFLTLLVCLYFSVLASINSNANKKKLKDLEEKKLKQLEEKQEKLEEKPEFIQVGFNAAIYEKTSTEPLQNFYNVLEQDKSKYKSNKLSVDNNGFITLSENKLYRISYRARIKNLGNRDEYVQLYVRTEKDNYILSSSLIIYETEDIIDEPRGGGYGSFLYDTTNKPLNERKIRPSIGLQFTTAVGNQFSLASQEGQSVFSINEVK